MTSLLESAMLNKPLREVAASWGVTAEQAANRLRNVPYVMFENTDVRGGGRGRPSRRLALDADWHFWAHTEGRPLRTLVRHLRYLCSLGEEFAVGVPLTSTFWQPFLHPRVRLFAPAETLSVWQRLFSGGSGSLTAVVDLMPPEVEVVLQEGLPVLGPAFALVDALQEFERLPNTNVLALADCLAHTTELGPSVPFAQKFGLKGDVSYLTNHRQWRSARILERSEVKRAHDLVEGFSGVPGGKQFGELLLREDLANA